MRSISFSFSRFAVPLLLSALAIGGSIAWWAARDGDAAASPPVYVAMGASDAVGVGSQRPSSEGWVPLVHAALPGGTQLLNLAVNGAELDDVLRAQLPVAIDAQPRWVTIWPGVNDLRSGVALEEFTRRLDAILSGIRATATEGSTQIIVANMPDLRLIPVFRSTDPDALDQKVRRWNEAIAQSAERHDATLVDLYSAMAELAEHPEYISDDGFHPSSAGYGRIAAHVIEAIDQNVPSTNH